VATALVALAVVAYLRWPARQLPSGIDVDGTTVTVHNGSSDDWQHVKITVNAYYSGGVSQLPAHGRADANVANLETGLGRRFDPSRERIHSVLVTATDSAGHPIELKWDR